MPNKHINVCFCFSGCLPFIYTPASQHRKKPAPLFLQSLYQRPLVFPSSFSFGGNPGTWFPALGRSFRRFTRCRGDRFFDETSAAAGTAALSKKGGDVLTASPGSNTAGDASEPVVSPTTTTTTKRRFLQGVPYLRVPLGLELASGTPPFTNFTPDFTETLDYVFIEGGKKGGAQADPGSSNGSPARAVEEGFLAVEGAGKDRGGKGVDTAAAAIAPMPEEGSLRAITPGLPSEAFPSDHISLVVDLVLST